jgi:hypothetical protein
MPKFVNSKHPEKLILKLAKRSCVRKPTISPILFIEFQTCSTTYPCTVVIPGLGSTAVVQNTSLDYGPIEIDVDAFAAQP